MQMSKTGPQAVARRLAGRRDQSLREQGNARSEASDVWRRETFTLPRSAARAKAEELFDRFPKAAYMTEIEFWQVLDDGQIEFTLRRLPTAD